MAAPATVQTVLLFCEKGAAFGIPCGSARVKGEFEFSVGASKRIAESLMGIPKDPKAQVRRPTDKELAALLDESKSSSDLVALANKIVKRVAGI